MATKKGAAKPSGSAGPAHVAKSHKSFQPILPCGNKLLQQKWDQTYYDQHRKLISTAKPMVDSKPPPSRPHLTTKLKKQQLERERYEEIDRDNLTLLHKMQHIMKTEGCVEHRNTYTHHSLNEQHRQREMERVARENKSMLKRLQAAKPMYKVSEWAQDWHRKEQLTNMIAAYPQGPSIPAANKIKDSKASPESTAKEESKEEGGTTHPMAQPPSDQANKQQTEE